MFHIIHILVLAIKAMLEDASHQGVTWSLTRTVDGGMQFEMNSSRGHYANSTTLEEARVLGGSALAELVTNYPELHYSKGALWIEGTPLGNIFLHQLQEAGFRITSAAREPECETSWCVSDFQCRLASLLLEMETQCIGPRNPELDAFVQKWEDDK